MPVAAGATCILDTAFGEGNAFLRAWQALTTGPASTGPLHYVGLVEADHWPPAQLQTTSALGTGPCPGEQALALQQALSALGRLVAPGTGFYRLPFDHGRVLLTLCAGPRSVSLAQLEMQADHMALDTCQPWTPKELHRLAALARRGTCLTWPDTTDAASASAALNPALWKQRGDRTWVFDPAWALRNTRRPHLRHFEKPGPCTVIGAGISGALVARALALRGWQVTVLEQSNTPAGGASGLPAGLVSHHGDVPADPRYGLTLSAYHLTRHMVASMLVQGLDWDEGGALHLPGPDRHTGQRDSDTQAPGDPPPRHKANALWLKPLPWIQACLATPGITLQCNVSVQRLQHHGAQWQALDAQGRTLASSPLLVLCNAMDAARLLGPPPPSMTDPLSVAARAAVASMHPVYGSISVGPSATLAQRPAVPVHGHGHFLPAVPSERGLQWMAGAGFDATDSATDADCHRANLARARQLVPQLTDGLQAQYQAGELGLWRGQRCVSHNRLPLVGPASTDGDNGLWMCLAMGARGLTLGALCAELLAARLMAEPLPLPQRLARCIDIQRLQDRPLRARHRSLIA